MEKLFKGENYLADITIKFIIGCHKIILSLHRIILFKKSDYFKKLFINGFKSETIYTITLDHISPHALLDVLNEIYNIETNSGNVPEWQRELEMMVCKDYFLIPFDGKKLLDCDVPPNGFCLLEKTSGMIDNIFLKILCHKHDIKTNMISVPIIAIQSGKYLNVYLISNDELVFIDGFKSGDLLLRDQYYVEYGRYKTKLYHLVTSKKIKDMPPFNFDIFSIYGTLFAFVIGGQQINTNSAIISFGAPIIQVQYINSGKYLVCQTHYGIYLYETENYNMIGKHIVCEAEDDNDSDSDNSLVMMEMLDDCDEFGDIIVITNDLIGYAIDNKFNIVKLPSFILERTICIDNIGHINHSFVSSKGSYIILIGNNQNIYIYDKNYNRISSFPVSVEKLEHIYPHPTNESKIIISNDQLYQLDIFTKEMTSFKNIRILPESTISVFEYS